MINMNKVFSEYTLKEGVVLKNKLVLAPMTTYSSNEDLTVSQEELTYYNSRAKQFGMIITAACAVSKNAQAFNRQISIRDERYKESMKQLATAITKEGSKEFIDLFKDKVSMFAGQTGAGKSSLLNILDTSLNLKVLQ